MTEYWQRYVTRMYRYTITAEKHFDQIRQIILESYVGKSHVLPITKQKTEQIVSLNMRIF